jgi:hypothetical protein
MSSESAPGARWAPSWRRLVGSTAVLFLVILAFLVGRVRAGADPGLVRETAAPQQQSSPPASSGSGSGAGVDPQSQGTDPFGQSQGGGQGFDPGTGAGGSTDNFGNAVPNGQSSGGSDDPGAQSSGGFDDPGSQGFDPPSTHVS